MTRTHLPMMQHLGSVTDIDGEQIEPVDVITFGSPCQDLSIAGRRAGLEGKRSGLFMEAVRIIREMRQATGGLYPRFAIWENVPGALSSNGGKDFETVINTMQTSLFDSLDDGRPPQTTERLPIASSMLNTGECPSAAEESTLSQILLENPPETLFLSEKALRGILTRASRRGKPLLPLLLTAINGVLAWMDTGKATPLKSAKGVAGEVKAHWYKPKKARRLRPIKTKPFSSMAFMAGQSASAGSLAAELEVAPTLRSSASGTNQAPTVVSLMGNVIDRQAGQNGAGIRDDGKSYTLDTISRHGVAYKKRKVRL